MKRGTIVATNDDAHINTLHITACRDRAQFLLISTFLAGELSEAHSPLGWRSPFPPGIDASSSSSIRAGGIYIYIYVCDGGTHHSSSSLIMLEDYIFRRDEFSDCLSLMRPCRLFLPHFTWFQFKSFSSSSSFLSLSLALPMSRKKTSIDELSTFSFRQTAATARCALIALMALFVCVFVALSSLLNKQDYFHKCLHPNDNFIFALHVSTNNYN
jgi:hypothetical protein